MGHMEKIEVHSIKANENNDNNFNHRKTFMQAKKYTHSILRDSSEDNIHIITIII